MFFLKKQAILSTACKCIYFLASLNKKVFLLVEKTLLEWKIIRSVSGEKVSTIYSYKEMVTATIL